MEMGEYKKRHKTNSLSQNPPFTILSLSLSHWKECNESLRINYSSSSLSDSSSKYDSIISISLTRISSTESVVDLADPS